MVRRMLTALGSREAPFAPSFAFGIRSLVAVIAVALASGVGTPPAHAAKRDAPLCDLNSCTVATALEDRCPCELATNHIQYVRCVAHAAKGLARDGIIAHHCRRRLVRLAAESVCGRPDATICLAPTSTCADDGTCVSDPNTDCAVDTDCGTQCETTTPDACDAANGITSQAGSCATAGCFSPSGAFLE